MKKVIKNNFRILKTPHVYLQTILKASLKFQKYRTKTVGGVKGTRYLLKIRNHTPCTTRHAPRTTRHAPRKAKNSVPPLFFEKAGDNNKISFIICFLELSEKFHRDSKISSNKQFSLNICFLELSKKFRRESKMSSNKPW